MGRISLTNTLVRWGVCPELARVYTQPRPRSCPRARCVARGLSWWLRRRSLLVRERVEHSDGCVNQEPSQDATASEPVRTILVTGAAGFIGASLIARALAEGYRVRGLDVIPPWRLEEMGLFDQVRTHHFQHPPDRWILTARAAEQAAPATARIAVCMAGQARTLASPLVYRTAFEHLLERGRHDLFAVLSTGSEGCPAGCADRRAASSGASFQSFNDMELPAPCERPRSPRLVPPEATPAEARPRETGCARAHPRR